jgi:STE24 endopeptidase
MVLLSSLWTAYLEWRQRKVYNTPHLPQELAGVFKQETFDKARKYQLDKSLYNSVYSIYKIAEFIVFLLFGVLPFTWAVSGNVIDYFGFDNNYEGLQTSVFMLIILIYSDITSLPWAIYYTFVLEEKHNFNKQTYGFFFKDKVKAFILKCGLITPIIVALVVIIKWGGAYFYIYAWLFIFIVTLIFIMVYHDFIAPCFDKYVPLPDGELKTSIESLAQSLEFPLKKLYVVEGSKRSAHSNAYFYGFGSNKRIVLFDTLLQEDMRKSLFGDDDSKKEKVKEDEEKVEEIKEDEEVREDEEIKEHEEVKDDEEVASEPESSNDKESTKPDDEKKEVIGCTTSEIIAVLSHELGHWYYNHVLKNIILSEINLFVSFFLFGYFLNQQDVFTSFGFEDSRPVIIGLIVVFELIFTPYNLLMTFIIVQMIRGFEYQADAFATQRNHGPALISALTKLVKENLSFPIADPLYANFNHTHPTFLERIRTIKTKTE